MLIINNMTRLELWIDGKLDSFCICGGRNTIKYRETMDKWMWEYRQHGGEVFIGIKKHIGGVNFSRIETIDGITKSLSDWCRDFKVPYSRVYHRMETMGWQLKKALTEKKKIQILGLDFKTETYIRENYNNLRLIDMAKFQQVSIYKVFKWIKLLKLKKKRVTKSNESTGSIV